MLVLLLIRFSLQAQLVFPGGGSGSYTLTMPGLPYPPKNPDPILNRVGHFQETCLNRWFEKAHPKVVSGFSKPIATNEWWSAHIWDFETNRLSLPSDVNAYGGLMYFQPGWNIGPYGMANHPHPLSLKGRAYGIDISSRNAYYITPDTKTIGYNNIMHLNIGVSGMIVPASVGTRVVDYGDWTVKLLWDDQAGKSLEVSTGHGLPYVYCKTTGGPATFRYTGTLVNWAATANSLGITINDGSGSGDQYYGIFFPAGTIVNGINAMNVINPPSVFIVQDEMEIVLSPYTPANASRPAFTLTLPTGKNYFSVAALPNNSLATLNEFHQHAFAFVKDSKVSWNFNEATADLTTTFTLETEVMEGSETQAIQALYRHQYLNSSDVNTSYTYASPRGEMRARIGNSFTTTMKHIGLLPNLPWAGTYDSLYLYNQFNTLLTQTSQYWDNYYYGESYEHGKKLGRYADLLPIARQVGHTAAFNAILDSMKSQLQNWFTAGPVGTKKYKFFFYDPEWNTLAGYPTGYMAAGQLNDHHFHYGYFIKAAAMVARFDPSWAVQWGPMVEQLIKDVNNWDRSDTQYPFLRFFDPYAGHSWASGHANFMNGNNQESATEAINFATAVALWGANTHNATIEHLGIFLATHEIAATQQYWWNKDNATTPAAYTHQASALVWGDKVEYRTWFPPGDPRHVHSINWLPITGASLFLGYDVNLVNSNYNEVTVNEPLLSTTPVPNTPFLTAGKDWRDLGAMYLALSNPTAAKAIESTLISEPNSPYAGPFYLYAAFDGTSWQMTHHWIHTLDSVGHVDLTTADYALTNVFVKNDCKHYVIYNPPGDPSRVVNFSDGRSFTVEEDTLQVFYWCPTALPAQLISFNGHKLGSTALLSWATIQESEVDYFEVQRSADGINFESIGYVKAIGNNHGFHSYSYADQYLEEGSYYYRLVIRDLDHASETSQIVSLSFGNAQVLLFPNPAQTNVQIVIPGSENFKVVLLDELGRLLIEKANATSLDLSGLANGIYVVKIESTEIGVVIKKILLN
jgi:endoglucanase Acf2